MIRVLRLREFVFRGELSRLPFRKFVFRAKCFEKTNFRKLQFRAEEVIVWERFLFKFSNTMGGPSQHRYAKSDFGTLSTSAH